MLGRGSIKYMHTFAVYNVTCKTKLPKFKTVLTHQLITFFRFRASNFLGLRQQEVCCRDAFYTQRNPKVSATEKRSEHPRVFRDVVSVRVVKECFCACRVVVIGWKFIIMVVIDSYVPLFRFRRTVLHRLRHAKKCANEIRLLRNEMRKALRKKGSLVRME